jgi:hypothetical protein
MKQGATKLEMQTAAEAGQVQAQQAPSRPLADSTASDQTKLGPEKLHELVALAAYYRAEQRQFAPGLELDDWLAAEAEIQQRLASEAKHSIS